MSIERRVPDVRRTKVQEIANQMDLNIYRILLRAEEMGERDRGRSKAANAFQMVAHQMRMARSLVRDLMHDADRKET